ncbi:MAG TPA: hypothetical protein VFW33_08010, partial [Gemmataceae bacterium]|nr:hypothetical protein [Gemmataceae bacterium]
MLHGLDWLSPVLKGLAGGPGAPHGALGRLRNERDRVGPQAESFQRRRQVPAIPCRAEQQPAGQG